MPPTQTTAARIWKKRSEGIMVAPSLAHPCLFLYRLSAKAGTQGYTSFVSLDPRFRGEDDSFERRINPSAALAAAPGSRAAVIRSRRRRSSGGYAAHRPD